MGINIQHNFSRKGVEKMGDANIMGGVKGTNLSLGVPFISKPGDVDKVILSYLKDDYGSEQVISSVLDERVQRLRGESQL